MSYKKLLPLSLLALMSSACTWVDLSAEGEKVRVLTAEEVTKCTFVGNTTSIITEKVVGVKRHENAINFELTTLARNSAIKLEGDSVVADGPAVDGEQLFKVYRCIPK